MYDFSGDYETVFTGETDSSVSGLIDTYRGSSQLTQWKEPHCNDIRMSSDGTKFKSFIQPNDTLLFYRKSMCRAQRLVSSNCNDLVSIPCMVLLFAYFSKGLATNRQRSDSCRRIGTNSRRMPSTMASTTSATNASAERPIHVCRLVCWTCPSVTMGFRLRSAIRIFWTSTRRFWTM